MKSLLILVGLIAFVQARIIISPQGGSRVINGWDVEPGEIPFQVSLQTINENFHFCGGSVLNENFVITAAHCVEGTSPKMIQVMAGSVKLSEPASTYRVQKIIVHKGYDPIDAWRHDIALLKIKGKFIVTSVLGFAILPQPSVQLPGDTVAVVSGWGRIKEGGASPNHLQKAEILIADQDYCRKRYESINFFIHNTHVCAHDPEEKTGSCHGDSGGPLTVNGKLVGLVSWAQGCANVDYPTVYTRVPEYLEWIENNIV